MRMNVEQLRIWEVAIATYFKLLSWRSPAAGALNLLQIEGQIHTCLSTRGPQGYK